MEKRRGKGGGQTLVILYGTDAPRPEVTGEIDKGAETPLIPDELGEGVLQGEVAAAGEGGRDKGDGRLGRRGKGKE